MRGPRWRRVEISRRRLLYLLGSSAAAVGLGLGLGRRHDGAGSGALAPGHSTTGPSGTPAVHPKDVESRSGSSSNSTRALKRWSDPKTWKGKVPGAADTAHVDSPILLDVDVTVAGLVIGPKGILQFDPARSRTLSSHGNVVVEGILRMRPASAAVVHSLRILDARESSFQGGIAVPVPTDLGLWVINDGILDAVGTEKRAWTRASGSVAKGASSIKVSDVPSGWRAGDVGSPGTELEFAL